MEYRSYIHPKHGVIFVTYGLSPETFGTFKVKKSGSLERIKSPDMPMVGDRDEAQLNLDRWAEKQRLLLNTDKTAWKWEGQRNEQNDRAEQ